MMNRTLAYFGVFALTAGSLSAIADVTMVQRVAVDAGGTFAMFGTRGTVTTMISGDKARSESDMEATSGMMARFAGDMDSIHILRLDRELLYQLNPAEQSYSEVSFDTLQAQYRESMRQLEEMQGAGALPVSEDECEWSEPVLSVEETGESERFAGVKARQTLVTASQTCTVPARQQQCEVRWVLDYWLARRMPGDDEAQAYQEGMARAFGGEDAAALVQMQAQGLMAMFKQGWDDVLDKTEGLKGFPVKSVMSLELGGEACTTSSGQAIALDDVWGRAADAGMDAATGTAAAHAGNAVARETAEAMGNSVGGSIAGSAIGAASRELASGLFGKMKRKKEPEEPAPVASETNPANGMVALFTISTELTAVDKGNIEDARFEPPADWKKVPAVN